MNGLGQPDTLITPHLLYQSLALRSNVRLARYRALFAQQIEVKQITDIRMALQQSQPLGDSRFADTIERVTGERRVVRPRGRPRSAGGGDVDTLQLVL